MDGDLSSLEVIFGRNRKPISANTAKTDGAASCSAIYE